MKLILIILILTILSPILIPIILIIAICYALMIVVCLICIAVVTGWSVVYDYFIVHRGIRKLEEGGDNGE